MLGAALPEQSQIPSNGVFLWDTTIAIDWSFEEKTFVKESLGTVLEILTKILRFAHVWLCYAFGGWGGGKVQHTKHECYSESKVY